MKFGTLFNNLAKKAGVDTTQKEFIDLLSTDIEIPDAIASSIDRGLMNIEAARNNSDVRKAIRTEALNGVDSKINELLEELGIEEADEITGEKNSYEKIAKLTRKIKETESKKAGANSKTDKAEIEKQLADLNRDLKTAKDTLLAKEKEFTSLRENDLTDFEYHKKLLGKNYSLPDEMDSDLKIETAKSAINKALSAKGLKLVRDADTKGLKLVTKDNLPAYSDTNEPLQVDTFFDGALAQNKLLKVNDQSQHSGGGNTGHTIQVTPGQGNAAVVAEIDGQLFK